MGLIEASITKANTFLREINRALHEPNKVDDWLNAREDTKQFQGDRYSDIIASLDQLNRIGFTESTAYNVTNAIQNLFLLDQRSLNADFNARRTLVTGYVPFTRRGKWQVRMQAYDAATGEAVSLEETYAGSIPFFQAEREIDALGHSSRTIRIL